MRQGHRNPELSRSGPTVAGRATRRDTLLAGFGGFCLCCLPARGAESRIEEIAPGIFMRRGIDEDASVGNRDAIANIGFIIGRDAVLVTDSGGSLADGQWLRRAIRERTDRPIRHVVLSHVHPDHAFGAAAFADDHPEFIGHAKLPQALQARGEFYRKRLAELLGAEAGSVVTPTRTVADVDAVDLGRRRITFKAHETAHTDCDLAMRDEQTGILLPADLLFVGRIPALDGSLAGWLRVLTALEATGATRAVPGHGPTIVDLAPAVAELRRYFLALRDGVRAEIKGTGSIEQAIKTVGQGERQRWALFDDYQARNVTEAYKEYEWE